MSNDPVTKLARELAPKPVVVEVYICPDCGEEHLDEDDARDCCPVDIETEERYKCPVCEWLHETEEEAYECCEPERPSTPIKLSPKGKRKNEKD